MVEGRAKTDEVARTPRVEGEKSGGDYVPRANYVSSAGRGYRFATQVLKYPDLKIVRRDSNSIKISDSEAVAI